jgi:hypothetical protein
MAKNRGRRIDSIVALDMETMRPLFGFGAQHFGPIAKAMGVRFPSVASNTLLAANAVNNAETAVVTTPLLVPSLDGATIILLGYVATSALGATTTSVAMRLRRGSGLGGIIVNVPQNTFGTAGNTFSWAFCYFDTPGAVAGQQYTLTFQANAATANTNFTDAALIAFAL